MELSSHPGLYNLRAHLPPTPQMALARCLFKLTWGLRGREGPAERKPRSSSLRIHLSQETVPAPNQASCQRAAGGTALQRTHGQSREGRAGLVGLLMCLWLWVICKARLASARALRCAGRDASSTRDSLRSLGPPASGRFCGQHVKGQRHHLHRDAPRTSRKQAWPPALGSPLLQQPHPVTE